MKALIRIFAALLLLIGLLIIGTLVTGNSYLLKGLWASYLHGENSATIGDAKYFQTSEIAPAQTAWEWPEAKSYNQKELTPALSEILSRSESVAFFVAKNDSILQEHYWDGYSANSRSNSFSMAKSIVTMLTQIAIQKGTLNSWNQKVKQLLPELKGKYADELELWHLSTMSSGLLWDEKYKNPFSITAKAYYGSDVEKLMLELPIVDKPGQKYNYQSGSTQLLGMALMKASGMSLSEMASKWLWKPLQAKNTALWHNDGQDMELAYCCFNSNARDFARFGKLMLNHGSWNGQQILDSAFVQIAVEPKFVPYYSYSFWLDKSHGTPIFYQRGILGQYIISIPEYNLLVVRLGHHRLKYVDGIHSEVFHVIIEEVLKMYGEV